jgi:ribA/ribD-fused uncharacterized protein
MRINSFRGKYKFLSNFYPVKITWEGIEYPSLEHAYQASKTPHVNEKLKIAKAKSPSEAKKLGRKVTIKRDWNIKRTFIMMQLLFIKFADPDLKEKLLETGGAELVEGNYWGDTFWGVCNGKGLNRLGKLLMEIREYIRQELGYL